MQQKQILNTSHVDTSSFVLKTNLANLKTEVDTLDIDKLSLDPTDLSKQSNVVKSDVVKETVYDKLAAKVNAIDTSDFVLKIKYNADKTELEKSIPNISDFFKEAELTELQSKITDVNNLSTKTALTAVENKIPSVSNLAKKTDYDTKVKEIENELNNHTHNKYIDTKEFNKLATHVLNTRIARANLITKTDFDAKLILLEKLILIEKLLKIKQIIYLFKMN